MNMKMTCFDDFGYDADADDDADGDDDDDDKMTKKQSGPRLTRDVCENHLNYDDYD